MKRYSTTRFPEKFTTHKIETHPEIKTAIKAIVKTMGVEERVTTSWRDNTHYLYGVDLFNAAYYWETHEVFEGLWRLEPKGSPLYNGLKGLIQLAVSTLKHDRKEPKGRDMLLKGGQGYLRSSNIAEFGVNIEGLLEEILHYQTTEGAPRPFIKLLI